jgi:hypothetical protein
MCYGEEGGVGMFRYAVVCGVMVGRVALTFRTASRLCRAGRAVSGMALQKDARGEQ